MLSSITIINGKNTGPINYFRQPLKMISVGDSLVILDSKKEHIFHLWDYKELINPFQTTGEGPDRVKNGNAIEFAGIDKVNHELYFLDFSSGQVKKANYLKFKSSETALVINNDLRLFIQGAAYINNSKFALTGAFDNCRFLIVSPNSDRISYRSEAKYSFSDVILGKDYDNRAAATDIVYNSESDLIIPYSASVNSIDLFKSDASFNRFYIFGNNANIDDQGYYVKDFFYYYSVKSFGHFAYGIYLGKSRAELQFQDVFISTSKPELHIYNLETNKLRRYRLDRLVNDCVLANEGRQLYCIEEDNEEQPIVVYEID